MLFDKNTMCTKLDIYVFISLLLLLGSYLCRRTISSRYGI